MKSAYKTLAILLAIMIVLYYFAPWVILHSGIISPYWSVVMVLAAFPIANLICAGIYGAQIARAGRNYFWSWIFPLTSAVLSVFSLLILKGDWLLFPLLYLVCSLLGAGIGFLSARKRKPAAAKQA